MGEWAVEDEAEEVIAKEIVRELLEQMGVEAEVVAVDNPSTMPLDEEDPPTIFIDVLGHDLGMLIGRRGDHLSQLQYLVNLIANRRLAQLGLPEAFPGVKNPFPWMSEIMDLKKEKNFFETRVIEYQAGGTLSWDDED